MAATRAPWPLAQAPASFHPGQYTVGDRWQRNLELKPSLCDDTWEAETPMRRPTTPVSRRSLLAGMAGASFMARSPKARAAQPLSGSRETFGPYDSFLFIGKPDLSPGFKRSRTVYENELW